MPDNPLRPPEAQRGFVKVTASDGTEISVMVTDASLTMRQALATPEQRQITLGEIFMQQAGERLATDFWSQMTGIDLLVKQPPVDIAADFREVFQATMDV